MTTPMLPRERCDYSAIVDRPPLKLPGNARLAFWTIAVTRQRLVVREGRRPMVDVPWTDPRVAELDCALDGDRLLITFDAGVFRADSGGTVEIRAHCADPRSALTLIDSLRTR